jgi:hypothetical protein
MSASAQHGPLRRLQHCFHFKNHCGHMSANPQFDVRTCPQALERWWAHYAVFEILVVIRKGFFVGKTA